MAETNQEKTEQPTAKRQGDAKRKGQVARSKELTTMVVTLSGVLFLSLAGSGIVHGLSDLMSSNFRLNRADAFDPAILLRHVYAGVQQALLLLIPFFGVTVTAAVLGSIALGGVSFSGQALAPKLSKLNPLKGIKRILSLKGLLELFKALSKFILIAGVTVVLLWVYREELMALLALESLQAIAGAGYILTTCVAIIGATLIVMASIDVPFQLWDHKRQLKMTRQEVRDELKETDGRPEVKARVRSLQREMAQRRMMEEVPKADVIVTNPTHFAVALVYDQPRMKAPKVVAKGTELIAQNIKKVGSEAKVPLVESPVLARALFFNTEVGDFIPLGLYLAVAKVLAYVFQLKAYNEGMGELPKMPDDLEVPEEFTRHP